MEEVEETIPHKRKASPSPSRSNGPAKRTKLEGDNSASKDDNHDEAAALERRRPQSPPPIATSPSATRAAAHDHEGPRRSPEIRRQPPQPAAPPGKKPFSQEEKKRGQRLFGGLLSTLSQKPTNSQQRRRQDIERRQQERAQQQRAEDDKRRVEKLARIKVTRQIEEIKFDEEVMRTRHEHLLSRARYLKTRSQPSIYYLPWETTKEQEVTIKEQTRLAEETITREKADFKARKECRLRDLGVSVYRDEPMELDDKQDQTRKETVGEPTSPSHSTNPPPPQADHHHSSPRKHHDSKHHDETGDELMMQDAEDTVIY